MTTTQVRELYDLRTTRAWSWHELANRYGISENEVRKAYTTWKRHLEAWAPFRDEHPQGHPDCAWMATANDHDHDHDRMADIAEWMEASTKSGEQLDLEMYLNFAYAIA